MASCPGPQRDASPHHEDRHGGGRARAAEELDKLHALGQANEMELHMISGAEARALGRVVRRRERSSPPTSGIVSAHELMDLYLLQARAAGALLQPRSELLAIEHGPSDYRLASLQAAPRDVRRTLLMTTPRAWRRKAWRPSAAWTVDNDRCLRVASLQGQLFDRVPERGRIGVEARLSRSRPRGAWACTRCWTAPDASASPRRQSCRAPGRLSRGRRQARRVRRSGRDGCARGSTGQGPGPGHGDTAEAARAPARASGTS